MGKLAIFIMGGRGFCVFRIIPLPFLHYIPQFASQATTVHTSEEQIWIKLKKQHRRNLESEKLAPKTRAKNAQKHAKMCKKTTTTNNKIVQKCANQCKKLRAKPKKLAQLEKIGTDGVFSICIFSISGEEVAEIQQMVDIFCSAQ